METTTNAETVVVVVGALLGFLVFFCTLFFGIIYVLSRMGWAQLAEAYRSDLPFPGEQFTTFYTYIRMDQVRLAGEVGRRPAGPAHELPLVSALAPTAAVPLDGRHGQPQVGPGGIEL